VKHIYLFLVFIYCIQASAQQVQSYSKARIDIRGKEMNDILKLGVDVSHGHLVKNRFFEAEFSSTELDLIKNAGFTVDILIEDLGKFYSTQNLYPPVEHDHIHSRNRHGCYPPNLGVNLTEPVNFELGSMGGFYPYNEIFAQISLMETLYPHLISKASNISNFRTAKGNPIQMVKISDNPKTDESSEPKILHTALHHAREPMSVTQMIYFMWFLLENYDKDPFIKALVDNNEIYLVPVVNPDGYILNQNQYPNGGGLHRKNRSMLNGQEVGVDLNRNYSYNWGFDDVGSSPAPGSELYRGPSAASEPEVQAIQWLCKNVPFEIALNFHAYGDAVLLPFGYSSVPPSDLKAMYSIAYELTRDNLYQVGRSFEVESVGYFTNGSSDDWMYGDTLKNKIFSFTPEIGSSSDGGFWPHISKIRDLCKDMLYSNIASVAMLGSYSKLIDQSPKYIGGFEQTAQFQLDRLGLRGGSFRVSMIPNSNHFSYIGNPVNMFLNQFETKEGAIPYQIRPDISIGEEISYILEVDNGQFIHSDTITKVFKGTNTELLYDSGLTMSNWVEPSIPGWFIDDFVYYTPPSGFSDSPGRNYSSSVNNEFKLFAPIDLKGAEAAFLTFRAKWAIEPSHDYVQISASTNGFNFIPLCGKFTKVGSLLQDAGNPVYDGFQSEWVLEIIDLEQFLGGMLHIKFGLYSDESVEMEGFHFDDFKVVAFREGTSTEVEVSDLSSFKLYPNPASTTLFYHWSPAFHNNKTTRLYMYNTLGQVVYSTTIFPSSSTSSLDIPQLQSGMYTYKVVVEGSSSSESGKLIIRK
jgi:carboxypeptidase T